MVSFSIAKIVVISDFVLFEVILITYLFLVLNYSIMLIFPDLCLRLFLSFSDGLGFLVRSNRLAAFNSRGLFIVGSARPVDFRFCIAIPSFRC